MKSLLVAVTMSAPLCLAAEKTVKMEDLPPKVQQAVKQQSQGATVRSFTTEAERGKTFYEAQLTVNGHAKDVSFDATGKVVSVEEEVTIDSIPVAAREAINKALGTGTLSKVEQVNQNGKTSYEAAIKSGSRTREFIVDANGKPVK